ncbi:toll/interleukin-1 receptor domain-containing protein [Puteibacter caeruleilacunae]|nr:toll/interleukin-1 receptor domain-containing protein [Puteibacter caeruleilacunae]
MKTVPKRVFLSYGHDEYTNLVRRIKQDLESVGCDVWMDETGIRATNDWQLAIEVGLKNTDSVVALMTPHSMRRPDGVCLDELAYARFQGKEIVPIMVKLVEPPLCISRLQWLDMQNWYDPETGKVREVRYQNQFDILVKAINGDLVLNFEGQQASLLNSLEPLDFGTELEKYVHGFVGREWIFDRYHSWLEQKDKSRVFFLIADAGFGKSAIAAMLAHNEPSVVGIHFVNYQDCLRSDPRRIMCTLAYQLSTQLPEYKSYLLDQGFLEKILEDRYEDSLPSLFDLLFLRPLRQIDSKRTMVFVIDAIDELADEQRYLFISLIINEMNNLPKWFRLVMTSRPDPEVLRRIRTLNPFVLEPEDESNINDLQQFAEKRLKEMNQHLSSTIIDHIVKGSSGNILYLKHLLIEIQEGRLSIEDMESFPKGLTSLYCDFFERQFKDVQVYRESVRPLLELVAALEAPLPLDLATSILKWDEYDLDDALVNLGGLFPIENDCIRSFHKSILDWLIDPDLSGRRFRVSAKRGAEKIVAMLWLEYECFGEDFTIDRIRYLLSSLVLTCEWNKLETVLADERVPVRSTYAYLNRFPEDWDLTKLKERIFSLNQVTWDKASVGIPTYNRELEESFAVFTDIASPRTASWFVELVRANYKGPNLPGFFRSGFSDIKCGFHMNPMKVRVYYAVKKVIDTLKMLNIEIPAYVIEFYKELRKSSLFIDGRYLLEEDTDPSNLFIGYELAYRGDLLEDDALFNTMSLKIEVDKGRADPSFVRRLLSFGADATSKWKGESLDSYAEKNGDKEVARIIREHLSTNG